MTIAARLACMAILTTLLSCGGGGETNCDGSTPWTDEWLPAYHALEECLGLSATPPAIRLVEAMPCPSGNPCCIAHYGYREIAGVRYGAGALYYRDCPLIELPAVAQCWAFPRHDAVHHLLAQNGRWDWDSEAAPELSMCRGVTS